MTRSVVSSILSLFFLVSIVHEFLVDSTDSFQRGCISEIIRPKIQRQLAGFHIITIQKTRKDLTFCFSKMRSSSAKAVSNIVPLNSRLSF